jgi:hypothetical protein
MTGVEIVKNYINATNIEVPIFMDTIKSLVGNNARLILSRLERDGLISRYDRGIYYKPQQTVWGLSTIGRDVVLKYKYIQDEKGNIKGYVTGARLFNHMGLTTQVPRMTEIATNEHTNKNKAVKYGALLQRARLTINGGNYLYQQMIDVIENRENIPIETDAPNQRIRDFFNDNELDFATLYKTGLERKMGPRNLKKMACCVLGD